jgi:hypothetical protein
MENFSNCSRSFILCQRLSKPDILVSSVSSKHREVEEAEAGHWEEVVERRRKVAGEEELRQRTAG